MPKAVEIDLTRANPTLSTILEIEKILEDERFKGQAMPLSLAEIERRMKARTTRRATIKTAVEALAHYGIAAFGSQGVVFTRAPRETYGARTEALA